MIYLGLKSYWWNFLVSCGNTCSKNHTFIYIEKLLFGLAYNILSYKNITQLFQMQKNILWLLYSYFVQPQKSYSLLFTQTSLRELDELLLAYAPQPSFDDMAWYSLAYVRVYEANKTNTEFFRVSKDIFNWIWKHGWDESGMLLTYSFWRTLAIHHSDVS